jgi:benzylsuccinate CoA-transferase BbsF subunit
MGNPAWTQDARFSTLIGRLQHVDNLDALLTKWTCELPAETVMQELQDAGVAAGVVQNAQDLLERDPQLRHRGHYRQLTHPVTGPTYYMGPAFCLSNTPAAMRPAPCLGEHNAVVYGDLLGMRADEIDQYTKDEVFY